MPDIGSFERIQSFENVYGNWLPTLNMRMKATDTLQFRLAVGKAISRPGFSDMQGYTQLNRQVNTAPSNGSPNVVVTNVVLNGTARGNPMLKPTLSTQVDLTAEWYPAPGKSLTLAVFNKELKDIVVDQMSSFDIIDKSGANASFQVTGPVNGARGHARGFELAGQTYFDNLPSWAQGLGVQAGYTFVDSKRKLYNPVFQEWCTEAGDGATNFNLFVNGCDTGGRAFKDLPLAGLSRRTINFALMYDRGPISARLAYNWRSRNMQQVAPWSVRQNDGKNLQPGPNYGKQIYYGLPMWASAYGQLDGGIEYKVTDNLQISFDAQNLNDAIFKQEMQQHVATVGHSWFASGPRYSTSIRYKF